MAQRTRLTVYLAGPVSNCNPRQRTEWRKDLKARLTKLDRLRCTFIDPADHMKNWTPFREMVEISKADVVIANLWRESIGAAGTLVIRKPGLRAKFLAELRRKLPFEATIA